MSDAQLKNRKTGKSVSPVAAGIAGIVAGGVAVAAAVVLSDKNNRKKVKNVLVEGKKKAAGYIDSLKKNKS